MLVAKALGQILQVGSIEFIDPKGGRHRIEGRKPGPHVVARIHDEQTARRLIEEWLGHEAGPSING